MSGTAALQPGATVSAALQPGNAVTTALAAAPQDGPPDMTTQYNTLLNEQDEAAYQAWGRQQEQQTGRNPAADTYDYDMRGFWKSGGQFAANGHAGDTFKKPNHPTFSTFSQYNGVDGHIGGAWAGGQNGQPWTFTPSPTNLKMNDAGDLQQYFSQREVGNKLILPANAAAPTAAPAAAASATVAAAPPAPLPIQAAAPAVVRKLP